MDMENNLKGGSQVLCDLNMRVIRFWIVIMVELLRTRWRILVALV